MVRQSSVPLPSSFMKLAWSNLFAQLSEQVGLAAAPLVAVLTLGASASDTGLLQTAQTMPFLLLSIPAGILADRICRKRLMVGSEALRFTSFLFLLGLVISGHLTLVMLGLLGFLGATGTVVYSVTAPALVPTLVNREQLGLANRWLELARSTAFAAGPAAGGTIVGWIGVSTAYMFSAVVSLSAVVLLTQLQTPAVARPLRKSVFRDLHEGWSFVITHSLLRPILITAIIYNTSWFILQAVYVAYAVDVIGMTPTVIGVTLGLYGLGMIVGAILAPRLALGLRYGIMIALGPLSALLASLIMLATIWLPFSVVAGLSLFLFGLGPVLWTIATITLRQSVTPNIMLGRVSALIMTCTFGSRPIGATIGAVIATEFGVNACLLVSFIGFSLQLAILLASPASKLLKIPEIRHA